jgi:hypothetical protein
MSRDTLDCVLVVDVGYPKADRKLRTVTRGGYRRMFKYCCTTAAPYDCVVYDLSGLFLGRGRRAPAAKAVKVREDNNRLSKKPWLGKCLGGWYSPSPQGVPGRRAPHLARC